MKFTEEDIPLMKLIFNPETHAMGMMIGQRRAEEIFDYVCNKKYFNKFNFIEDVNYFYRWILLDDGICNLVWDNNILQLYLLTEYDINFILAHSPIAEKIWDSGKLNVTLLKKEDLELLKQKFESI